MNNLKMIAISTITGGLLAASGAGIAKSVREVENLDVMYAGLIGMSAGFILSATSALVRRVYQACAKEEVSIAASSSDAESSDGDEHARYYLKNLLDSWKSGADEESLLSDDYPTTLFYGAALAAHAQSNQTTFSKEQTR